MKRKLIFSIILFIAFSLTFSVSYAQELVYSLDMIIHRNDTVELKNMELISAQAGEFADQNWDYSIKVTSNQDQELFREDLRVSFFLSLDPIGTVTTNSTFVHVNVPYFENAKRISVSHLGREILNIDLSKHVCDKDGLCELGENPNNCPEDCQEVKEGKEFPLFLLILLVLVISIAIIIFLKNIRKKSKFESLKQKWE